MLRHLDHPEYDAAMELLCLLPLNGTGIQVNSIVEDLNVDGQAEVRALAGLLRRNVGVRTHIHRPEAKGLGLTIGIDVRDRNAARGAAADYWHRVYETARETATTETTAG